MKTLLAGLLAFSLPLVLSAEEKPDIRVACVGDSITQGARVENPGENSYPAQLGRLLGEGWQVRNFGVSGTTLLTHGSRPYRNSLQFPKAQAFEPDLVVIKLGTNDTAPNNWKLKNQFVDDYVALIESFQALNSKPKIWICYPVPAKPEDSARNRVIHDELQPMIDTVAQRTQVPVIDLYTPLSGNEEYFADKLHPNAKGALVIAETIAPI